MYRNSSSRIVPIIIVIIVIVALIAGLVAVGRYLFGGTPNQTAKLAAQQEARSELLTINADRSVKMTVRGPIVANENFTTTQISVSPNTRTYTLYNGYLDSVKATKSYDNNTQAYEEFVYALDKAALTTPGKYTQEEVKDLRGICATGKVYEFDIMDGSQVKEKYWTSTCKGSPGSFGANVSQVSSLFVAQLPTEKDAATTMPSLRDL